MLFAFYGHFKHIISFWSEIRNLAIGFFGGSWWKWPITNKKYLASMSRKDQSRWFGLIGFFKELRRLQQFELQKQQQQQHLRHFTSSISIVWRKSIDFIQLPIATGPVAVGDAHHDEEEDKAEEDEPGDDVHDRRRDRDGDRGLHLLSPFQRKTKWRIKKPQDFMLLPYQKERQSRRCKIQLQCAPAHSSRKTRLLILAPLDSSNSSPSPCPCLGFFNWCLIGLAPFPNL